MSAQTTQTRRPLRAALFGAAALIVVGGAFGASNVVPFTPARAQSNAPAPPSPCRASPT